MERLILDSDNLLELTGLTNGLDNTPVNNASVSVTLLDDAGQQISGATWPLDLAYVSGSQGDYRATLPASLVLSHGQTITAHVIADAGAGLHREWYLPLRVLKGTK